MKAREGKIALLTVPAGFPPIQTFCIPTMLMNLELISIVEGEGNGNVERGVLLRNI
jgi:hypothetical protein